MGSQVFGNLLAALLLESLSQGTFYIVMTIAAFTGSFIFLFLTKPVKYTNEIILSCNSEAKSVKSDEGKEEIDTELLVK